MATDPSSTQAARSSDPKRPMKILGGAIAVGIVLLGGYLYATWGLEETDDAQINADVIPMATRAPGLVTKVLVLEDQPVKRGDVIMQLDEADQAARVRQAEAELNLALAQLASAQAQVQIVEASATGGLKSAKAVVSRSNVGIATAQAQIESAKAALARAQADTHRAELEFKRIEMLRQQNAASQERFDNASAAYKEAQATQRGAEAQLVAAQAQRNAAQSSIEEAQAHLGQSLPVEAQIAAARAAVALGQAQVMAAEARLEQQRLIMGYLKVTAPVDGVLSRMSAHEGQLLATGQAIGEMVPAVKYITANFKETQIGHMKPGQLATVKIDAFGGHTFTGKIDSISGGTGARFSLLPPDNATGNFVKVVQRVPVRISLLNVPDDVVLRAGLSCDVTVHVAD